MVNEKGESDEPSMTPHLWSYRPKVTVEHLSHYLEKGNYKKRFPILHQFLKQVCGLFMVVCRPKVLADVKISNYNAVNLEFLVPVRCQCMSTGNNAACMSVHLLAVLVQLNTSYRALE